MRQVRTSVEPSSRTEHAASSLRAILDDQTEPIVRYRLPDGRITFANQAYARLFDSTPRALEGSSVLNLFASHDLPGFDTWIAGFTPEEPVRVHDTLAGSEADGPRWHRWSDSAIFSTSGELLEIQAVGRDLSNPMQLGDDVRRSEARFRLAFDHAQIGMALINEDCQIRRANDAFKQLLGCSAEDIVGRSAEDFIAELPNLTDEGVSIETAIRAPGGFERWCWVSYANGGEGERLLQVVDVHDRKTAQDRLAEMVGSDSVTGLANRRGLQARLSRGIFKVQREGGLVAVVCCDLDGFKLINDSLGHGVGDDLLRSVAERLRTTVRPNDTAARFGGDEFVIVLSDLKQREDALAATNRIRQALAAPHAVRGGELTVGASIGLAITDGADESQGPKELLRAADAAMYLAKAAGTGEIVLSDSGIEASLDAQIDLRSDLEAAAHNDTMRLHYQPIIDANGQLVAAEALIRWQRPGVGPVAPDVFLPMLERSGLMASVGQHQLRRGCREMVELSAKLQRPLDLWFNVGLREVVSPNFASNVSAALSESGMPPERLCLELTEWSELRDRSRALEVLAALSDQGIRVALDDFGTGYAAMDLLRDGPLACLKIDRGFTSALSAKDSKREKALVAAMIHMALALDMEVVAEGVENQTQQDRCVEMGATLLQGWHLGRPAAPSDW